ncbi:MAG: 3-isopropylmalate dehydratase small subunit [Streptosporangiaceae bacterium]
MQALLEAHTGLAAPLRRGRVDTDQIIPAEFCKRLSRSGYADTLFFRWRDDPGYPLSKPEYARASILVAGPEFGIGSSREHAVWALRDSGFWAVIAPSFGDIFRANATKNRLITARTDEQAVHRLWDLIEASPQTAVTVDLISRQLRAGLLTEDFDIDDYSRSQLITGANEIELTLRQVDAIAAYEEDRPPWLPVVASGSQSRVPD